MIRTLLPMAADGIGPSHTCARLADGIAQTGMGIEVMVNRRRGEHSAARMLSALPRPLSYLPYSPVSHLMSKRLERWFLQRLDRNLHDGDIAWLWPGASLEVHRQVAQRGVPIVMEGINTRMGHAKIVLDAAYEAFGAPAHHGITDARIAEEEEKMALATTIFAPSPAVEAALVGSPLQDRFLRSSYGVDLDGFSRPTPRAARPGDIVTFLFVGYACIRKGIHHLLDVWDTMPATAHLTIVGRIEPVIAERYADLLASDRVTTAGFTRDVAAYYKTADVFCFPSLEEGDPLVTYEAAAYGLPLIATQPGGGRMAADHGVATLIDPASDPDGFKATLLDMWRDGERRDAQGDAAAVAVRDYDWRLVGARRAEALQGVTALDTARDAPSTGYTPPLAPPDRELVSVVMPAYNRSSSITSAIESVLRQTWDNLELIVVDDGSKDDTPNVVLGIDDPRIRLIRMEKNAGPSAARNRGIAEAKGRWVAFQDSDDEWLPNKLALQMDRIAGLGPDVVAAYCGMAVEGTVLKRRNARVTVRYLPPTDISVTEGNLTTILDTVSMISTQMLVARRDTLLEIGCFDEDLQALEDWDLSIRLAEQGQIAFVDRILVIQRFSANSITRNRRRWAETRAKMIAKHIPRLKHTPEILSQQYRVLAGEYRREGMIDEATDALAKARHYAPRSPKLWVLSLLVWQKRLMR